MYGLVLTGFSEKHHTAKIFIDLLFRPESFLLVDLRGKKTDLGWGDEKKMVIFRAFLFLDISRKNSKTSKVTQ